MLQEDFRKEAHFDLLLNDSSAMRLILIFTLFIIPLFSTGQSNLCKTDGKIDPARDSLKFHHFQSLLSYNLANPQIQNRSVQYFPVVIHVVSRQTTNPVSEAQVLNQLDVINADFSGNGENILKLLSEFVPLLGRGEMKFCLATVDPNGQATSGITFTHTDIPNIALQSGPEGRIAVFYDQLGGKTGWDPTRYINVWIGEYGDFLGSASFPGAAPFSEEIGIVIDPQYFGSIGEAGNSGVYGRGHTLTHEMGHFFGLKHIWGKGFDANCDDSDDVPDTPNAEGPYFGCPSGQRISCNSSDMYQNFMDLTDDRCLAAFTKGQVAYMQSAIETYYPGLAVDGECATYTDSYSDWYAQLIWSYDASSNTYVIYSDEILDQVRKVEVYGVDGRLAYTNYWDDQQTHLMNLSALASGIYFVRIAGDGNKYFVRTIVLY